MDFTGVGWKSVIENPMAPRFKEIVPSKASYVRSIWKPDLDRLGPNVREMFVREEIDCSRLVSEMERLVCFWSSLMLDSLQQS